MTNAIIVAGTNGYHYCTAVPDPIGRDQRGATVDAALFRPIVTILVTDLINSSTA